MSILIDVKNVTKVYKSRQVETHALNGINLQVKKGEFLSVMGPSGSGKTTLLNILSTVDKATDGEVIIDGTFLSSMKTKQLAAFRKDKIGFLFQEYNLLDHLTVFDNIALPLTFDGVKYGVIKKKVQSLTEKLNIKDIIKKYPYELSGGQRQRVACARAIIKNPSVILADEPTGALDSKSSQDLLNILKLMNEKENVTVLMVTHDPFSASFSHRVVFLKDGLDHSVLHKKTNNQRFYHEILDQLSYMAGDDYEVV